MKTKSQQPGDQAQHETSSFETLMDSAGTRMAGRYHRDAEDAELERPTAEEGETDTGDADTEAPEETSEQFGEQAQPERLQDPQSFEAPQHWPEVDRQKFKRLPPDQQEWLLNRHSAMEADYTRKTQQVAEYRKQIADFIEKAQQQQKNGEAPAQQKAEKPHFDDPVEELKWEAKEAAKAELQKEFQNRDRRLDAVQHQMYLEGVKQHFKADPMYSQVHTLIHEHVKTLPPSVGRDLYRRLDSDPRAYAEMYQTVRTRLQGMQQPHSEKKSSPTQPQAQRRESKAPVLESGGGDPGSHVSKAKKRQNEIVKRVRSGKASSSDLGSYLDSLGVADRLVG